MKHNPSLDGWRGLSILLLIAGHYSLLPEIAGRTFYTGRLGVERFFVLSGRLMAELLFVQNTPLGLFYWRRASRILPALWLFVGTMLLADDRVGILNALAALTFTSNYFQSETVLAHTWSLCVEEHSYIVLSLVALWLPRRRQQIATLGTLALLCAINGAVQTWVFHKTYYAVYLHSDVRMASVFVSAALYLILKDTGTRSAVPVVAALVGVTVSLIGSMPDPIKYTIGTGALALSVASLGSAPKWVLRIMASPILTSFGIWSFSLYLWQQPFAGKEPKLAYLAIAMACALVSYYVIERPARSALNRWRDRRITTETDAFPYSHAGLPSPSDRYQSRTPKPTESPTANY